VKTCENVKDFMSEDFQKNFLTIIERIRKQRTFNDFLRKLGTTGSTKRIAVGLCGRLFLSYFSFTT